MLALPLLALSPLHAATVEDLLPGARPTAMGAYGAVADDALSLFYNPAGLARMPGIEMRVGMQRELQAGSPLGGGYAATARPVPGVAGAVAGVGWYGVRAADGEAHDDVVFGWSQPLEPLLGVPSLVPHLFGGVNLRVDSDSGAGQKRKNGIGADFGLQSHPAAGTHLGLSVLNLVTGPKGEKPIYILGGAYDLYGWLTLAADLRSRDGVAILYPGVEAHLDQGLLDLRVGKGVPLNGVDQVAFGWGVNLDPLRLDAAFSVPWYGFNLNGGAVLAGVSLRFGTEGYLTRFLGRASQAATRLQNDLESLKGQKEALQKQIAELESSRIVSQQEIRETQFRLEEMRLREQTAALHLSTATAPAAPASGPLAPAPAKAKPVDAWPKKHRAVEGETLRELAGKYYGDPGLWEQIYDANKDRILRGLPEPGAELVIPAPKK